MRLNYTNSRRFLVDSQPRNLYTASKNGSTGGHGENGSNSEANFDTNMVIILAALLCALIFALGLNSIVRCALRCSRRIAFESPNSTAARRLAMTGLKKSKLKEIPVAVYGSSGANDIIPATECPICLGEFVDGEKVRVLPKCKHGFHVRCVDLWLASHSSCPTCRQSLLEAGVRPQNIVGNESGGNNNAADNVPVGSVEEVG